MNKTVLITTLVSLVLTTSDSFSDSSAQTSPATSQKAGSVEPLLPTDRSPSFAGTPAVNVEGAEKLRAIPVLGTPVVPSLPNSTFNGVCAQGILEGKLIQTDCSISQMIGEEKVCFSSESAKELFTSDGLEKLERAKSAFKRIGETAQ